MSAPSQCVKWMISGAAMPGNRYLVPPEKPATSCGNTGPQISTWSYCQRQPVEGDRHVFAEPAVR